ncbi:IclR family transcriptional regulator [Neobacillus mesonae]|uniref:IclR family transcriptional regulator n=1 Tax=Neobacillus mesonae TaxID=1193713 RepID=UPI00257380E5|nr:IclR family transcriptional regulator [Neobacillus mesonae]MED4203802.1 IclR family transcriptional regulator [Neobacillus mesonae]
MIPFSEVLKTVEKAFKLIEMIAEQPMTFTEMMMKADSNKATIHRFLSTFEQLGYVTKDHQEKYYLSQQWFQIALKASSHLDLLPIARPYLESITETVKESTFLALLAGDQVQYVEKIESKSAARIVVNIGQKAPLFCVASGKVYLAHFDDKQLQKYLHRNELEPCTENTITSKQALLKELKQIRTNGYAIDNEEWEKGLKGISFPIFNARQELVCALSISGLSYRFNEDVVKQAITLGLDAAKEISLRLGFTNVNVI